MPAMGGFVNSKQGHVTSYARKQKINEMPAVSSEMSFDGRSLSVHTNILYILEIESLIYILPLTVCVSLHSNFSGGHRKTFYLVPIESKFRLFKVIHGH